MRVQGIQAGFFNRSYPVGGAAKLAVSTDAKRVRLQLFSFAGVPSPTVRDLRTSGLAVAPAVRLDWSRRAAARPTCVADQATRAFRRAASTSCA